MKRALLLTVCALMISGVSMADHIGVYSDATGQSCNLGNIAGQFSTSVTIVHKFASGATGSRFKVSFPPGTSFFTFNTPYVDVGSLTTDLSLGYEQCLSGCIVLGTLVCIYGVGDILIQPGDLQASVLYVDCSFTEKPATGGSAGVNKPGDCFDDNDPNFGCTVAVEPSTWGSVKALYR